MFIAPCADRIKHIGTTSKASCLEHVLQLCTCSHCHHRRNKSVHGMQSWGMMERRVGVWGNLPGFGQLVRKSFAGVAGCICGASCCNGSELAKPLL